VDEVDRLDLASFDVVLQLSAGVALERVRRLVRRQPLCKHGLGIRACAACDRLVLEGRRLVIRVPDLDERLKPMELPAAGPPREDLQLALLRASARIALSKSGSGHREQERDGYAEERSPEH